MKNLRSWTVPTMTRNGTFKLFQYSSLIGCFLVLLCVGLPWFWGNLSVYIASYFFVIHGITVSSAWTPSVFLLTWNLPALAVHIPSQRLGTRWTMLLGIAIMDVGLLLGLLGIWYPEFPLEIGFGALYGLGACFTYTVSIQIAMDWTYENTCLAAACLQAAFSAGGLVTNQLITSYINPSNEKPMTLGNLVPFFNDRDINERVPKFIKIFIVIASAISLLGFALLRDRRSKKLVRLRNNQDVHSDDIDPSCRNCESKSLLNKEIVYTPRDLLKSKTFYVLLYGVFTSDVVYLVSTTYYKSFGQTKISDDHFLTFTGTTPPFFCIILNVLTGIFTDWYGPQVPMMTIDVLLTFASLFFYFSPLGGKWAFYVCLQIFMAGGGTFYNTNLLTFIKIYGRYQFPIKLTMLFSVSLISTLTIPYVLENMILPMGWFATFTFSSVFSIFALILIAIFIPHSI